MNKRMNTFGISSTFPAIKTTFESWPLPFNTILVSKSLRVQETTRLCWGLYDSNYIICPIYYCFIHVRIICFGFPRNVLGFACPPERPAVLRVSYIGCLSNARLLSSWLSNHDAQIKCTASFHRQSPEEKSASDCGRGLFTWDANWVRVKKAISSRIETRQLSLLNTFCIMTASSLPQLLFHF